MTGELDVGKLVIRIFAVNLEILCNRKCVSVYRKIFKIKLIESCFFNVNFPGDTLVSVGDVKDVVLAFKLFSLRLVTLGSDKAVNIDVNLYVLSIAKSGFFLLLFVVAEVIGVVENVIKLDFLLVTNVIGEGFSGINSCAERE